MSEWTAPSAEEAAGVADEAARERLLYLRSSIDNLDAALVHLLAERFKCTQQVGELKARHSLPPADPTREAAQIERLRKLAEDARLDPAFAEKFLNFIIDEVVRHHKAIAYQATNSNNELRSETATSAE
ncbi:chorismate mutase [Streptomyces gilvosporeus]|uniref:Chorismate mutase n=1 Tax=Streptomyces gilvosporeus TaxID=553510 RepID=A0A1V0TZK8_9ACTN|nr:chorismate mutase [Streptomyces gilvosporeus]ARF58327.1 chorismate mutase [Streptomyces gilvosporeus]